ncbi:MAG: M15 family metallopeptidase, partial [Cyclobacteriaceae bacterium]|nr:M15 family metallopeptidase [Cyclobacteriaceae bacterium]
MRLMIFLLMSVPLTQAVAQMMPLAYTPEHAAHAADLQCVFAPEPILEAEPDSLYAWLRWKTVANFAYGKDRGNLPMIADLEALHPYFRDKVKVLVARCREKGITLAVVETFRTHAKQNEYKSMGKNYTRSKGGRSKHQYGLAVDVVPIQDSVAIWDNRALWRKIGAEGERLGLRWGGRWRSLYDPGHFEWTGGLGSHSLAQGVFPSVPKPTLYPTLTRELTQLQTYWQAWEAEQGTQA